MYLPFRYELPTDFLKEGDVRLVSVLGYYTDWNICGIKFTFSNGTRQITTNLFGFEQNPKGQPTTTKEIVLTQPVTKVSHLMANT